MNSAACSCRGAIERGPVVDMQSRREFMHMISWSALLGLGAMNWSCNEETVSYSENLDSRFLEALVNTIDTIIEQEAEKINDAAGFAVQAKLQGRKLYALMNGGMLPAELFHTRRGNPEIFLFENIVLASRDDLVVTNEPNAARGLGERLVKVVGISRPDILNEQTPSGTLDQMGSFRIEDVADLVLYSHVPYSDGVVNVEGVDMPLFAMSGIMQSLIFHSLSAAIAEKSAEYGIFYPVAT